MSTQLSAQTEPRSLSTAIWVAGVIAAVLLWFAIYWRLEAFSTWIVSMTPVPRDGHLEEAARFFVFETPKVLMLLGLVVFGMGIIRSFFSPERTRAVLAGKREGFGNIAAAGLGVVTPFCSCSAVPMFVGFISAGVPLGVALSFLISAPMVNEVALGLLFALVGWKVAAIYLGFGLAVAIVSGWVIGRFNLEDWLEDWVRNVRAGKTELPTDHQTTVDRIRAGLDAARDIVGRVWIWMIAGIAIGAFIHGYAPTDMFASLMGRDHWWSIPAVVLIAVPIYSNAAGIIPVVVALLGKGAPLGAVLAFMMSVIAISFPEMVILRKVLKPRLIAVFIGVVATGIIAVGYLFDALLS